MLCFTANRLFILNGPTSFPRTHIHTYDFTPPCVRGQELCQPLEKQISGFHNTNCTYKIETINHEQNEKKSKHFSGLSKIDLE